MPTYSIAEITQITEMYRDEFSKQKVKPTITVIVGRREQAMLMSYFRTTGTLHLGVADKLWTVNHVRYYVIDKETAFELCASLLDGALLELIRSASPAENSSESTVGTHKIPQSS